MIKNFYSEQNLTLDEWANISFEECKKMAIKIAQVCCDEMNLELRKNKKLRKTHQLVIKEKDRKRNILTKLGNIEIRRDYYYDKNNNCYTVPIDRSLGIQAYKRISENVCAELVEKSTEYSYAKSIQIVPLVSVTEGTLKENGRNKTINPVHFVNEEFKAKELWKEVDSYIHKSVTYFQRDLVENRKDGVKKDLEN